MKLIELAKKYFSYFSNKDIDSLKVLFSSEIKLRDWEIDIEGYDNVIKQNIKIFDNLNNFNLKIIELSQSENTIFAEIEIILADNEVVRVLDRIKFNNDLKIIEITAFKG